MYTVQTGRPVFFGYLADVLAPITAFFQLSYGLVVPGSFLAPAAAAILVQLHPLL